MCKYVFDFEYFYDIFIFGVYFYSKYWDIIEKYMSNFFFMWNKYRVIGINLKCWIMMINIWF